jgi:hypothetical protein
MIRKIFAVAALATVFATPAFAKDTHVRTVVRDGVAYSYKTIEKDGVTVLQGTGGSDFRYEIRGDKVTGQVNGTPVAFNVSDMDVINADLGN